MVMIHITSDIIFSYEDIDFNIIIIYVSNKGVLLILLSVVALATSPDMARSNSEDEVKQDPARNRILPGSCS